MEYNIRVADEPMGKYTFDPTEFSEQHPDYGTPTSEPELVQESEPEPELEPHNSIGGRGQAGGG